MIIPIGTVSQEALCNCAVQNYLNAKAVECGYDSIDTACSYAAAINPFQVESLAFVAWRGNVWSAYYGKLAETPLINPEELILMLPILEV